MYSQLIVNATCAVNDLLTDLKPLTVCNGANVNKDGLQATPDEIKKIPIPSPEVTDNYIRVKIQLPRGTSDAQGRVNKRASDNGKNVVGRATRYLPSTRELMLLSLKMKRRLDCQQTLSPHPYTYIVTLMAIHIHGEKQLPLSGLHLK